jgi:hypothetical protein
MTGRATPILGLVGALAIATMAAVHVRQAPDVAPSGDHATTSLFALRAARGDLLVGAYSRFGWNHPGPLLYQVLAPGYALSGFRESSVKWTALTLNLMAIGGLIVLAFRHEPTLAVLLAASIVPLLIREGRLLFWAWNPVVTMLPFGLLLVMLAAMAAGRLWLGPALAGVASFLVQSHVGFTPVVLSAGAVAAAMWLALGRPIDDAARRCGAVPLAALALGVTVLLWLAPFVDLVRHWPGNLGELARFFVAADAGHVSWSRAASLAAFQWVGPVAPAREFLTDVPPDTVPVGFVAGFAGLLALVFWAGDRARRAAAAFECALAALVAGSAGSAVLAIRAINGPVPDYLTAWIAVPGSFSLGLAASAVVRMLAPRAAVGRQVASGALVAYVTGVAALGSSRLVGKHAAEARSDIPRVIAARASAFCRAAGRTQPLLDFDERAWPIGAGVVLQFYKGSMPLAVADHTVYRFGPQFRRTGAEDCELYLMPAEVSALPTGVRSHEWVTTYGGFRLVRLLR